MIEIWMPVPSTVGYEVSNAGQLRRYGRMIAGHKTAKGYRKTKIVFDGKHRYVNFHRIIALAFLGPCPVGMCVDHINCDMGDNRLENLRYLDSKENVRRAFDLGRGPVGARHGRNTKPECSARGERTGTSKMTSDQVLAARKMRKDGSLYREIAAAFGISQSQAFNIASGAQWKHL